MSEAVQQFIGEMKIFTMRLFCEKCGEEKPHAFLKDSGKFEVYECRTCGTLKQYAVR